MDTPIPLLEFPSTTNPSIVVYYNRDPMRPRVLHTPKPKELSKLIERFEEQIIARFWEKAVLPPSPYHKTFPNGLASTSSGHAIIDVVKVLHVVTGRKLCGSPRGSILQRKAKSELRNYDLRRLQDALRSIMPQTIEEVHTILTAEGHRSFGVPSLAAVSRSHLGFEDFVSHIWSMATSSKTRNAPLKLLLEMRSKNWVLCPTDVTRVVGNAFRAQNASRQRSNGSDTWDSPPSEHITGSSAKFYDELKGGGEVSWKSRNQKAAELTKCLLATLCTSANSVRHLTWPLVQELLSIQDGFLPSTARQRDHWRALCEANGPAAMRDKEQSSPREELAKRCPSDQRLNQWLDVLAEQCSLHRAGNLQPLYKAYAVWLKWLSTLETVPEPGAVQRHHIRDDQQPGANTFRAYVAQLDFARSKLQNEPLVHMSRVFDRLCCDGERHGQIIHNPIRYKLDRFHTPTRRNPGSTTRSRLPEWIMQELQELLVTKTPTGGYEWTDTVKNIGVTNFTTMVGKNVFNPLRPAIIYLMLVYPLRSHQVRWLDSGELDALVYDFKNGGFHENPNRIDGQRDAGCLQPARNGTDVDFQVTTNKTLLTSRRRSAFTIPYTTPECLWVIQQVLDWQKQYGPPPTLVKEVDEPIFRQARQQSLAHYYPEICPLFRSRDQESFYPPTSTQISYFWGALCHAWDERNLNFKDPKTGAPTPRPGCPKLSRIYERGGGTWHVANFDLHSLRVAGVSSLLDAGLPLAMVSSVAGHKSLAMTLHYYKAEQESLRVALKDAYSKLSVSKGFENIAEKLKEIDSLDEYQRWFKSTPEGIKALHESTKTQASRMFLSGICPGTSCDRGLPDEFREVHGRSVPGSRCPLCKYFVYGPAFLPGMIQEANCLLYELGEKAKRQLALRRRAAEAEDEGDFSQVNLMRHEEDILECESRLDLKVFIRLHSMIEEAIEMANATPAGKNELIVHGDGPANLAIVIERISEFSQWHEIVAMAEIMPSSRQVIPDQVLLRMQDKLLGCLVKNGIEPFFLKLPEPIKKKAILQLADLLEQLIPDEAQRDRVLDGESALANQPALEQGLMKLIQQTRVLPPKTPPCT